MVIKAVLASVLAIFWPIVFIVLFRNERMGYAEVIGQRIPVFATSFHWLDMRSVESIAHLSQSCYPIIEKYRNRNRYVQYKPFRGVGGSHLVLRRIGNRYMLMPNNILSWQILLPMAFVSFHWSVTVIWYISYLAVILLDLSGEASLIVFMSKRTS